MKIFEIKNLPVLQNRVYNTVEDAKKCVTGNVCLELNELTGIIENSEFDASKVIYDSNYNNEQSLSSSFYNHIYSVSKVVEQYLGCDDLVEVGCGKGFFLELLLKNGFDVIGFDPTYEGKNSKIQKKYFDKGIDIKATGIILRHVLEHIKNPIEFLFKIKDANGGGGLIYIEVPCFDWIINHNAWFDIFYEHVNYFRVSDFERMFGKILLKGHSFNGQYLSIVADLSSLRNPDFPETHLLLHQQIQPEIETFKDDSYKVVWGGASKGVTFCIHMQRAGIEIHKVIDINPAKQCKYFPVTGLLIESPENALKEVPQDVTIYVMNSNYLDEVKQMTQNMFKYKTIDDERH